jgi:hypothetical protein
MTNHPSLDLLSISTEREQSQGGLHASKCKHIHLIAPEAESCVKSRCSLDFYLSDSIGPPDPQPALLRTQARACETVTTMPNDDLDYSQDQSGLSPEALKVIRQAYQSSGKGGQSFQPNLTSRRLKACSTLQGHLVRPACYLVSTCSHYLSICGIRPAG